jgi:hypothetical protein
MNNRDPFPARTELGLELLDDAIAAFSRESNLEAYKSRLELRVAGRPIDASLHIKGPDRIVERFVEIRHVIAGATLANLADQFANTPGRWILITRHVSKHLAGRMRELGIEYIDTAGNAYVTDKSLVVSLQGKNPTKKYAKPSQNQLWGSTAVKTIFALLCNKHLIDAPYREIASKANVALGALTGVFSDLVREGFVVERGLAGRRMQRKKELFDKWNESYALSMRSRTRIGTFAHAEEKFWMKLDLSPFHAVWGGEVAAFMMTRSHDPVVVTIYSYLPPNDLLQQLNLIQSDQGHVEFRHQFWRFETTEAIGRIAPPILVYADLMATAVSKNVETAKTIYEAHIERHLRED